MNKLSMTIAMAAALAVPACGGEDAVDTTAAPQRVEKATNVVAMQMRLDTLTQVSRYPASVEAWRDVQLSFLESGPVLKILVDLGDSVEKGQLLATLHTSLLDVALTEAEAGAKFHRYDHKQSKQLFDDGTISERDFFQSEYDMKRAESNLATIRQRIKNSTLRAPFSGTVAARAIEVGHLVTPSHPAIQMVQWDRVKMRAWVSESEVPDFAAGCYGELLVGDSIVVLNGCFSSLAETRTRRSVSLAPYLNFGMNCFEFLVLATARSKCS